MKKKKISRSETFYIKIIGVLTENGFTVKKINSFVSGLKKHSEERLIDFELIYRGLKKVILKKGNKQKNIQTFFDKLKKSLTKREKNTYYKEPEKDDTEFGPQEPSILSKSIYRKELFELQVDLLKLQEWLMKTNKTAIIVFEGRDSAGKGSSIKKFIEHLNPKGFKVVALGIPTTKERKNWWKRYESQI